MWIKVLIISAIGSLLLAGCGGGSNEEEVAPLPSGVSGTVRVRVNYAMDLPSMIDRYLEARIIPQGASLEAAVGSASMNEAGHTKGIPNQQTIRVTGQNLDPEAPYSLVVGVYESAEKAVQLYRGECPTSDCLVITQGNPTEMGVNLVAAVDEETLYRHSVPDNIRQQCQVTPTDENCGQNRDRVYYDSEANTCKRFTFTGCGEIEPFSSMPLCQQGCIR